MGPKAIVTQRLMTVGIGVLKVNEEWDIQKLGFHVEPPVAVVYETTVEAYTCFGQTA